MTAGFASVAGLNRLLGRKVGPNRALATAPFPFKVVKPRVQVVYIDRDHLHLEPGRGGAPTEEKG